MEPRRGGTLPVAPHLRPGAPAGAADDIAMACSRVECRDLAGVPIGNRYKVQFIPAADVHSLPVEGEA